VEQKSDVEFRAEKIYRNSREKFGLLLREVVSNAIHATIIRRKHEGDGFSPNVSLCIHTDEKEATIHVRDNGEGFTDHNRKSFTHLDYRNPEKQELNLHPIGQGRLAIVYFSDSAMYESVYRDSEKLLKQKIFNYPDTRLPLFDIEGIGEDTDKIDSETTLTMKLTKQQTHNRAKTFFSRYDTIDKLGNWCIENFFPFFMENESLQLALELNTQKTVLTKSYIESNVIHVPFEVNLDIAQQTKSKFDIWLVKKEEKPRQRNQIICFARHLRADISDGCLDYEIDLHDAYDWLLTSQFFDELVDEKGEKIYIEEDQIHRIQERMTEVLDEHFADEIRMNRVQTEKNVSEAMETYHSLSPFMDETRAKESKRILKKTDIVYDAIERKGRIERDYWTVEDPNESDIEKLLNSSLHIYIDHRKRVLEKFCTLVRKFDEKGNVKHELEDQVHDLFLKRGVSLNDSDMINHLHNLWIIDDKYTIFSETFKSRSTQRGQKASDIYFWSDDQKSPRELLILELKSTSTAHNAGNKYESMVAQVKRYAAEFYKEPDKVLNWSVDPDKILYYGIILARKNDINKEINSNNIGGTPFKIPFLEASYFFNEKFSIGSNRSATPQLRDIRIEMYSYEDLFSLSSKRNEVFFRLLQGEYKLKQ